MNTTILEKIKSTYSEEFGGAPEIIVRSPGRINLIGEHTDYNLGFVLPAAVDKSIYMALGKSGSKKSRLVSVDQDEDFSFDISQPTFKVEQKWYNYVLGAACELLSIGKELDGFNVVFSGDVPQGAGMSSSAALECGTALGLNELFGLGLEKEQIIKASQKAEHNYVGVMCGIMDQFASVMGKEDQVILLDCRSLEYNYFPLELKEYSLLLCNSHVSHNLASSEYNVRRTQCEEGVALLKSHYPQVESLRDVTMEMLQTHKDEFDAVVYLRCKYVVEENERVERFCDALKRHDFDEVSSILASAQDAMKNEYEITCPEIDFMADFANSKEEVKGARMMGGGFGGCTINLVKNEYIPTFKEELASQYKAKFDIDLDFYDVNISDGTHIIK
ncbi:galactokinase [Fulvivirga sediminis]|uniref:Galactokinase n=1 Tax=Fulvivirga sediminis TaxID=2803949 RepID=A0A937K2L1_9BACT|nr:galactokinase [Fulvivirga sediminis]MBL3658495.1 galactokinase [Fulvivirga sediminis]